MGGLVERGVEEAAVVLGPRLMEKGLGAGMGDGMAVVVMEVAREARWNELSVVSLDAPSEMMSHWLRAQIITRYITSEIR